MWVLRPLQEFRQLEGSMAITLPDLPFNRYSAIGLQVKIDRAGNILTRNRKGVDCSISKRSLFNPINVSKFNLTPRLPRRYSS